MENSDYKKIAENLAMHGYVTRLDNFEIDAIHIALDAIIPVFEDAVEFRAKLRRYHRADPSYHAA